MLGAHSEALKPPSPPSPRSPTSPPLLTLPASAASIVVPSTKVEVEVEIEVEVDEAEEVKVEKRKVRVSKGFSQALAAALDEDGLESNAEGKRRVRTETDMTDRCESGRVICAFTQPTL